MSKTAKFGTIHHIEGLRMTAHHPNYDGGHPVWTKHSYEVRDNCNLKTTQFLRHSFSALQRKTQRPTTPIATNGQLHEPQDQASYDWITWQRSK